MPMEKQTQLKLVLAEYKGFHESLWQVLSPSLQKTRIKRQHVQSTGYYDMFFISTGIVYVKDISTDTVIHFICPLDIVPDSVLDENYIFHFLEESELIVLPKHQLEEMNRQKPSLFGFHRSILQKWIIQTNYRVRLLDMGKQYRKQAFKKLFPLLPAAVPNILIANYLSMSPEYFSRTGW